MDEDRVGAEEIDVRPVAEAMDSVDSRIGISNPNPAVDGIFRMGRAELDTSAIETFVARDRSARATFSAVSCGTAGIGLEFPFCLPNVIILGCARTATGTGAAAMMAVERYAVVAMDARV